MDRAPGIGAALVIVLAVAGTGIQSVAAAADCEDMTFLELFTAQSALPGGAAEEAAVAASAKKVSDKTDEAVASQPTNISLAGADSGTSTLNFLPFLSLSGLSGSLLGDSNDSDNDQVGLDFNIPLPGHETDGRQLKIAASFNREPAIFKPLLDSVAADQRDAFRTGMEDDLDITDDATFSLVYNLNTKTLGRYRGVVSDVLTDTLKSVSSARIAAATDAYRVQTDRIRSSDKVGLALKKVGDVTFVDSNDTPLPGKGQQDAARADLCKAAAGLVEANKIMDQEEDEALERIGINTISKLANNRPQLHFALDFVEKDDAVGPDEVGLNVTFEWGYRASINRMSNFIASKKCGDQDHSCIAKAFAGYIEDNKDAIASGDRLTFSLEYKDVDAYNFANNDMTIMFNQASSRKIIGKLAYGRTLADETLGGGRLDLTVKYEDVDSDTMLNDRAVAVLTLTRKFGDMNVPFSLIYSNKPEFVTMASTDRLSANFGIKYEMGDK